MQLWDLRTNKVMAVFEGALGYDTSDAVFSPDGQYVAADLDNLLCGEFLTVSFFGRRSVTAWQ